jgi:general secretion pathway protein D
VRKHYFLSLALMIGASLLEGQTIAEKKAHSSEQGTPARGRGGEDFLSTVNHQLVGLRSQLDQCYQRVSELQQNGAPEEKYQDLLVEVNQVKQQISAVEKNWRETAIADAKREDEGYALWDQEETTLAQVIMEYGAMDYLYIVPPEMATMKLHMHSSIPIPRESWGEVLEIVLAHNGIGVKKLNAYARQLFVFKQDPSAIQEIAARPEDLKLIPNHARLFYVLSPPAEQVRSVFQFLEKFADPKQAFIHQVGPKIAIVAPKEEVEKLLSLYGAMWMGQKGKVSRVLPVSKISVKEMEKILQTFFGESIEKARPPFGKVEQEGLNVFTLSQGGALVLIGQKEVVDRAEKMVRDTEDQLQDPCEMTVYLYTCRHSDPIDLAKVLEKVYASLLASPAEGQRESTEVTYATQGQVPRTPDGYATSPPLVVSPPPLKPGVSAQVEVEKGSDHFIPDPKTGTLLMVVRRDALVRIKDLLRKLDIPKKMVQIEVLLFEKQINNRNNGGLNMLKLGSSRNGAEYHSLSSTGERGKDANLARGVFEFFFGGKKSKHFPAYDIAYSFMMTQEDVQLNAAPSVITVNQTPATISIVDEISINNGAAPVDTNKGIAFEKSFSRSQYGITIVMTPTVHLPDKENEENPEQGFVTLQTNITFDTPRPSEDDRPPVNRRHIENEVRIVDGQTVIIGGLRKKTTQDLEEKIPFLGDIPGFGKLFGSTRLSDNNTEMFFFITPTIIEDPKEQFDKFRAEELKKRPGDSPEFLEKVIEALNKERKRYYRNSFKAILGENYGM